MRERERERERRGEANGDVDVNRTLGDDAFEGWRRGHQGRLPILRAQWFHCHTTLQTSTDLLGASFFGLSEVDFKNRRGGIGLGFYFLCIVSLRFIMSLGKILCALQVF